jgi:hypothetical protein
MVSTESPVNDHSETKRELKSQLWDGGRFLSNALPNCVSETAKARSFLVRKNIFASYETV